MKQKKSVNLHPPSTVEETRKHRHRVRANIPTSIDIKPGKGESYVGILKAIRGEVNVRSIGVEMKEISQSKSGKVIFKLSKEDDRRKDLEQAIRQTLGSWAAVRELVKNAEVKVLDFDRVTTEEENLEAIREATALPSDDKTVQIRSLRSAFKDTKRATVTLRMAEAVKLTKIGRLRVSWINAKVRLKMRAVKCYKCLSYEHVKYSCTG